MWSDPLEASWRELMEEVMTGMKEWRLAHPKATFKEIEAALDERLAKVRARMLQDAALASAATRLSSGSGSGWQLRSCLWRCCWGRRWPSCLAVRRTGGGIERNRWR